MPIERFEIFATGLDHPEGLAFDRHGYLWAGGEAGQVYRIDPDGRVETIAQLGGFCAGLAFSPEDELFVCNSRLGIVHVKRSGEPVVFADQAAGHKIIYPNYPLFDSRGNLYLSDSGNWKKNNGCLLCFDPNRKGEIVAGPFGYSNGLALSADEKSLFMVESDTDSVFVFAIQPDGGLGERELYAHDVGRVPDGLALDCEGNLYVCCYASDEIYRIQPTGERTLLAFDRNRMLLGSPTNMAFGGKDFDELYVANLGRYTIARARIGRRGQALANQIPFNHGPT
jgi:gluconolactonase